ncbi:MAG: cytochrome b N-terminal domain-containing protein [Candidatus Omnitrophica bacterium]|nr:cytochrome b N-terminal domain-containing protein [Candidatus Omnitrophota bacterium]
MKLADLARAIRTSAVWKSVFRHGYQDTPRNRALMVLSNVFLHLHPVKVRPASLRFRYTWGLGGLSFYLFLLLTVSGVLLMFYYRPTVDHAYWDMKDLRFVVPFGSFLRNIHRWSAHVMVLFVMFHMISVFYRSAYKAPREYNWVVGVILLLITFLLSFTGYLLPWDQLAIWAVTVGTNMAANTPLLGAEGPFAIVTADNDARFILLGSKIVGEAGLIRFYVLHCVLLPLFFIGFVSVHFWRVRKDEFSAVPLPPREERDRGVRPEEWLKAHPEAQARKVFTWPNLVSREFVAALVVTAGLSIWSVIAHAPLEELANPNKTPNPSKAPWYFVGLQELLVYFDPWIAGVVLPTMILLGLAALPYLDPNPRGIGYYNFRDRKFASGIFTYGIALWFILIGIGYYLRGPGWEIYWPWEPWDHFRPASSVGLSNLPNGLGILFLLAYGALGMLLPKLWFKNFYKQLGPLRYLLVMFFVLGMFFVPVKMILRNVFRIKYIVSLPDFNLNI